MSTSNGTSSRPVDRVLAELAARFERMDSATLGSKDAEELRIRLRCVAHATIAWMADIDNREEKPGV